MTKLAKLAGTLPFAHLLGIGAARAESESDDEDKDKKDAKKAKAEGDDEDGADAKAEGDDAGDDKDDKSEDDTDKKDAKKAKAESDDEDEESDDDEEKPSAAVQRDRARCAKIVAHGIKAGAVRQACAYAFDTNMSATVAIATLDATAADRKQGTSLADRMAVVKQTPVRADGGEPAAHGATAQAQTIMAAAAKARGQK
jgi:hypothetical protein